MSYLDSFLNQPTHFPCTQLVLEVAQKKSVLGEVEARHQEIVQLEANIRVS